MRIIVTTPGDYLAAVIGDLQSRRGSVAALDIKGGAHENEASVPLANILRYVNPLLSQSQGRTTFTMQLDRYTRMPKALQAKVLDPAHDTSTRKGAGGTPRPSRASIYKLSGLEAGWPLVAAGDIAIAAIANLSDLWSQIDILCFGRPVSHRKRSMRSSPQRLQSRRSGESC